jgi:hypothetical protein
MRRQLSLILLVACLSVGCATNRPAESDVLVSNIARGQSANLVCPVGEVRLCTIDEDDVKHCQCADHSEIFPRR